MRSIRLRSICVVMVISMVALSGCATKPRNMYSWGTYETQVYSHFKGTGSPEQQIAALEKTLPTSTQNVSVPPGYHAHLGLLYGEVGRVDDMKVELETEKMLFPESAPFMDFMLNKMSKNNTTNKNTKGAL